MNGTIAELIFLRAIEDHIATMTPKQNRKRVRTLNKSELKRIFRK